MNYLSRKRISVDFKITAQAGVWYDEEVGQYVSACPALDLYSQGDTEDQAISNIQEAGSLFLETCYELGTLNQVLQERGFRREGQADRSTIPLTA